MWAHYADFRYFACFFHTFQNDHFRAFFTIFLQLTTANSVNRYSPASFPYINANPSSRDYICQVIASGCTYKLQKRFVCVCVVLIYGKIGPLKVSDFDLFLAFFDSVNPCQIVKSVFYCPTLVMQPSYIIYTPQLPRYTV